MKFGKTIRLHALEAWKPHYIDYKFLKTLLRKLKEEDRVNSSKTSASSPSVSTQPVNGNPFVVELDKELVKTSTFYQQKESQCETKLKTILARREKVLQESSPSSNSSSSSSGSPRDFDVTRIDDLLVSNTKFLEELYELKKFAELNLTGFDKITKKHDKNRPQCKIRHSYMSTKVRDNRHRWQHSNYLQSIKITT